MRLNPHLPRRSLTSSCSRLFAKSGYRVAIIARNAEHVKKLAQEINTAGFEAAPFKLPLEYIEVLGGGPRRSRGCFWLPTRPSTVGVWEGAGGQLSVGSGVPWGMKAPLTRIVVTGLESESRRDRKKLVDTFHRRHNYLRISLTERCNLRCEPPLSCVSRTLEGPACPS